MATYIHSEQVAMLALSRVQVPQLALIRELIETVGSAKELLENAGSIGDIVPCASPRLRQLLCDRSLVELAEKEMVFIESKGIKLICFGDEAYPTRLAECADAPLVLHSLGNADLNARRIVSIVGTRHASEYGKSLCENFVADLARFAPGTLIVSGLAYGIDVCAHRAALKAGLPTVGVLAHGLDRIYPGAHRATAKQMLENGGLLTEFMSGTNSFSFKLFAAQQDCCRHGRCYGCRGIGVKGRLAHHSITCLGLRPRLLCLPRSRERPIFAGLQRTCQSQQGCAHNKCLRFCRGYELGGYCK